MSRSYSTFREVKQQPLSDGWKKTTYSPMSSSDHLLHQADAGERPMPVIRHGSNGETYVLKAEKIVEQRTRIPGSRFLVSEYRYSSEHPRREELFKDYGYEDQFSLSSTYPLPGKVEYTRLNTGFDRPEEVEEIINEIWTEAGCGLPRHVSVPLTSTWHTGFIRPIVHEHTKKYSDERDFKRDDMKILNRNELHQKNKVFKPTNEIGPAMEFLKEAIKPSYVNANVQTEANGRHPIIKTVPLATTNMRKYDNEGDFKGDDRNMLIGKESYLKNKGKEAPRVNEGLNARNYQLSKPTNETGPAMEFLKEAMKPSNGANNRQPISKTVPLATTNWRTGSTNRGTKTEVVVPKDYDSEDDKEEESRNLHHGNNNRGGLRRPFENRDGYENPKGINGAPPMQLGKTHFPPAGTTVQKKEENSYSPEKIDSKEAGRRYGKSPPSQKMEEKYKGTINSRDALVKYNGALVPS